MARYRSAISCISGSLEKARSLPQRSGAIRVRPANEVEAADQPRKVKHVERSERPCSGSAAQGGKGQNVAAIGGTWLQKSSNNCALVFVHGLFSSTMDAWRSPGAYWPDIVFNDPALPDHGIYLFGYDTGIAPGNYSISDATNALHEYLKLDGLLNLRQIVFVAHSMGGIIARKLAVSRQQVFTKRQTSLGFFLVASPSLGSNYANLFAALIRLNNLQIDQLRFSQSNTWLNDLDTEFTNLKESPPFPIFGRELIEADPVKLPRALLPARQIVVPISAAKYFGEPLKIPTSNHLTIAKPDSAAALQHRILVEFLRENVIGVSLVQPVANAGEKFPAPPDGASGIAIPVALANLLENQNGNVTIDEIQHGDSRVLRDYHEVTEGRQRENQCQPTASGSPAVSVARLPPTGQHLFGRDRELSQLDSAWENSATNFFSIVAWGGVGKSSLVNRWLGKMAADRYRGARRVYAWSFYKQGTGQASSSADEFITEALGWFGDANATQGEPWARGARLAALVRSERTLLILDGIEPLQATAGPEEGRIADPALATLVRELGASNNGLCIATSRQHITDIAQFSQSTAVFLDLDELSDAAGAELLRVVGVNGEENELSLASREFGGHALALSLLGTFLRDFCAGEICRRGEIALAPDAPASQQGWHALRIMNSYERELGEGASLAILRLLGLFDRPADEGAVMQLRSRPLIAGLNDSIIELPEREWASALMKLRRARLLLESGSDKFGTIDAHPLVRDYFGRRLKSTNPEAWRKGHHRIFDYLCKTSEALPDNLQSLFPLFQAVTHGCSAGLYAEALRNVYIKRIQRGRKGWFATKSFGVPAMHLSALSGFFESQWQRPIDQLDELDKVYVLTEVAYELRALGRLRESIVPLEKAFALCINTKNWMETAGAADNLSEVLLYLGDIRRAVDYAKDSVKYADKSGKFFEKMASRSTLGNALHQAGKLSEAAFIFGQAEELQRATYHDRPYLRSINGLQYCDLLLSQGLVSDAVKRATQILQWLGTEPRNLVPRALCGVFLGKALLKKEITDECDAAEAKKQLFSAVSSLRSAGQMHELPSALLGRAAYFRSLNSPATLEDAKRDLDEALIITSRLAMKLILVDVKCELVLFHVTSGDIEEAEKHLLDAKLAIESTGYGRRKVDVDVLVKLCANAKR